MKPKLYEVDLMDFTIDIKEQDIITITGEFTNQPKFQSFLIGEVTLANGEKRLLSLNKTSYKLIASKYGKDTIDWVNKEIKYQGQQKMGNMMGRLWEAI